MPSGGGYQFGPFTLDVRAHQLLHGSTPVPLKIREFDVLLLLVSHPGEVFSTDRVMDIVWKGVNVNPNTVEQVVSRLRRALAKGDKDTEYIRNRARVGYEFAAPVESVGPPPAVIDLDALLAPHRALIEGRAAIESLERDRIARGRDVFEYLVTQNPNEPTYRVGLANALALLFESTRTAAVPDVAALRRAVEQAETACRLKVDYAEAWATLGFVLERTGNRLDALAALRRAVSLEPNNWRHHLRHAACSWGEERLGAALRTLALLSNFPLAHLLAATVYIARDAFVEAERHIDAGILAMQGEGSEHARFSAVALHWVKGLLLRARGEDDAALASFDRELALEARGHLYARECCANTWYAIGAVRLRCGDKAAAMAAFAEAIARVPFHAKAQVGQSLVSATPDGPILTATMRVAGAGPETDAVIASATVDVFRGDRSVAASGVAAALATAPIDSAGWTIPIEPLLGVQQHRDVWAAVLAQLRVRAS